MFELFIYILKWFTFFKFLLVCYDFLFLQLNLFKFQIYHSPKKIITMIKPYHKLKIDITQIIDRHIQKHNHLNYIFIQTNQILTLKISKN